MGDVIKVSIEVLILAIIIVIIIASAIALIYWYRHSIGMKKRFIKSFLPALILGLLYGFTAIVIDGIIPYLNNNFFDQNQAVHFFISLDLANKLLIELIGLSGKFQRFKMKNMATIKK